MQLELLGRLLSSNAAQVRSATNALVRRRHKITYFATDEVEELPVTPQASGEGRNAVFCGFLEFTM